MDEQPVVTPSLDASTTAEVVVQPPGAETQQNEVKPCPLLQAMIDFMLHKPIQSTAEVSASRIRESEIDMRIDAAFNRLGYKSSTMVLRLNQQPQTKPST